MRGVARQNDRTLGDCSKHGSGIGGTIVTFSTNVKANDLGVARLTDQVLADCGCVSVISSACETVIVNDLGAARIQDTVSGPTYNAIIVTCSPDKFVDDLVNIGGVSIPNNQNSPQNAAPIIAQLGYSAIDDEYETNDGKDVYPPEAQTKPPEPIKEKPLAESDDKPADQATPATDCSMITEPIDYSLQLSTHFTLADLSVKAVFPHGLKAQNGLTLPEIACNLKSLSEHVLEAVWDKYPGFRVNSGFRTRQNGRSQHEKGQAADLQWPGLSYNEYWERVNWIKDNINYDQLIWEHGNSPWIHVSFNTAGNRSKSLSTAVMTMYRNQYSPGLKKMA